MIGPWNRICNYIMMKTKMMHIRKSSSLRFNNIHFYSFTLRNKVVKFIRIYRYLGITIPESLVELIEPTGSKVFGSK